MRFIACQPATIKMYWQCATLAYNLTSLGVDPKDIYLIFSLGVDTDPNYMPEAPARLAEDYGVSVYTFQDERPSIAKAYIPSIKPYLMWRFFDEHPEARPHEYLYQDSDVVYRDLPNFDYTPLNSNHWYGSDTDSYTGIDYITSKGPDMLQGVCDILGVDYQRALSLKGKSVGAQLLLYNPEPKTFKQAYEGSYKLYHYFKHREASDRAYYRQHGNPDEYPIQAWCASMYAEWLCFACSGIDFVASKELDFAWATDSMKRLQEVHIYHDAGVSEGDKTHFFKGDYNDSLPFKRDFSWVDPQSASHFYTNLLNKVQN